MAKRQKFNLRSCGSSFKQMGATSPMKTGTVIAGAKKGGKFVLKRAVPLAIAYDAITDNSDKGVVNKIATAAWNNTIGFGLDALDAGVRAFTGKQTNDMKTTPWSTDGSVRDKWFGKTNKQTNEEKPYEMIKEWDGVWDTDQAPKPTKSKNVT
tara:strand:+ start:996 stop:1454 length:459 start_codon:yes stop_codon:yes gene_type:complete